MTQDNDAQDASADLENQQSADLEHTSDDALQDEAPSEQASQSNDRRTRLTLLAIVLLLCIAVGLAWTGYWAWTELNALKVAVADVESGAQADATKLAAEQQEQLDAIVVDVNATLANTDGRIDSLEGSVGVLESQIAQSNAAKPAALVIAELEYLLRQANHRLALESDRDGALFALAIVQSRLTELGNDGFAPLQAQLTIDMAALQAVEGPATVQAMGAITKLLVDVDSLHVSTESRVAGADSGAPENTQTGWQGVLTSVTGNLGRFVDIRKAEGSAVPALIPDQEKLARHNIRLSLANARGAAVRGDAQTYQLSLQESERWLTEYFPAEAPGVVAMKEQLSNLRSLALRPSLPTLDGSLALIRAISHTDLYLNTELSVEDSTSQPTAGLIDEGGNEGSDESTGTAPDVEEVQAQPLETEDSATGVESSEMQPDGEGVSETSVLDQAMEAVESSEVMASGMDDVAAGVTHEADMSPTESETSALAEVDEGTAVENLADEVVEELIEQQDPASEVLQEADQ